MKSLRLSQGICVAALAMTSLQTLKDYRLKVFNIINIGYSPAVVCKRALIGTNPCEQRQGFIIQPAS